MTGEASSRERRERQKLRNEENRRESIDRIREREMQRKYLEDRFEPNIIDGRGIMSKREGAKE